MQTLTAATAAPAAAAPPPPAARRIPAPLLQRQSLLRSAPGVPPLVYAASWWCAATVDRYLSDSDRPIWKSLALGQVEVYREILEVRLFLSWSGGCRCGWLVMGRWLGF